MKTEAIVDKYQKIIGGLLKLSPGAFQFQVQQGVEWKIVGKEYQFDPNKPDLELQNWMHGTYRVVYNDVHKVASFKLYQLPHCCGVIVSCNAFVETGYRGKRVGTALNNLRQDIARALGYTMMICTDIDANTHQRKLLATNGWTDAFDFVNKRTNNKVYLAYIRL